MDDEERTQPTTFNVDTLEALAKILRAGARLTCNANHFFVLEGPRGKGSAGGPTIASAVSGYIETVLHARTLTRQKGLEKMNDRKRPRPLFKKGERVKLVNAPVRDEDDEGPPPVVGTEFTVTVDQVAMDEYPYIDVRGDQGELWSFASRELERV